MNRVAVIGSLNMDVIVEVEDFPKAGQTITAKSIDYRAGGKGINTAAAAASLGASTILIGTVGEDTFGQQLVAQINKIPNLDGSRVINSTEAPTGVASILATDSDNCIAVVSGANNLTNEKVAKENKEIFQLADVLISQFEIPEEGIRQAFKEAHMAKTITILNPAPYRKFKKDLLEAVSIITPNETEFDDLCIDFDVKGDSIEQKMLTWQKDYPNTRLVVTRGGNGVSYVEGTNVVTLSAPKVKVVDTIGAGDTFNGALGSLISREVPIEEAIYKASVAAGLSVTHKGALGSAPRMEEVDLFLSKTQEGADNSNY